MKIYLEKEINIPAAYVDRYCELGPFQASLLFQDNMTELFYNHACDAVSMQRSHGAVWAVVRSKLCYERPPIWMERVRIKTYPVKLTQAAVHLECVVETMEGEPLLRCRQELCPIDAQGHTMRRINTTPFPLDAELLPPQVTEPFRRRKAVLSAEDLVNTYPIRTTDTDMNSHMNNVAYVRPVVDAFPSAFWDENQIKTFDIHYASEGREGETLQVLTKEEEGEHIVFLQSGGRTLTKSYFRTVPRQVSRD